MASKNSGGIKLSAQERTEFGKGAARRIRRADMIPAVLFGHGEPLRHITLQGHATMLALKVPNSLLSLDLGSGEPVLAIARDVQVEPVRRVIEHVDLVIVRSGERIEIAVPIHIEGEVAGGVNTLETPTLLVTAEATHLPEQVVIDVSELSIGDVVTVADLTLPSGTEAVHEADATVLTILAAPTAEEVDEEMAEAEAEAGIERDEKDVDEVADEAAAPSQDA